MDSWDRCAFSLGRALAADDFSEATFAFNLVRELPVTSLRASDEPTLDSLAPESGLMPPREAPLTL